MCVARSSKWLSRAVGTALLVTGSVLVAGCDQVTQESGGDVRVSLETAAVVRVGRVSSDSVRIAIQKRLESERPVSIPADSWRHVRALYRANTGGPLWLGARGLDAKRVRPLFTAVSTASNDALNLATLTACTGR
jgi:hypothetical protein